MHAKPMKKFGRPLKHEGLADNPNLSEAENRRLRRRTANRESARRVRDRRSDHAGRLEKQVDYLAAVTGHSTLLGGTSSTYVVVLALLAKGLIT